MTRPSSLLRARLVESMLCLALLAGALVVAPGCQPRRQPERELFDEAEEAYRNGHYDRAIEQYEAFLKASPEHQLARLAQERILNIERELEVVMGRRNGPRPIYLRPVVENHTDEAPRSGTSGLPGALEDGEPDEAALPLGPRDPR